MTRKAIKVLSQWGEWKGLNGKICADGIINGEAWEKAPKKLLFVLKETNDYEGELKGLLKNGPFIEDENGKKVRAKMWHTVSKWANGILKGAGKKFGEFKQEITDDEKRVAISMISAINLKKMSGEKVADMSVVNAYAVANREPLLNQIKDVEPEIILACGVFDILVWLLDLEIEDPAEIGEKAILWVGGNCWVIPCEHPACRGKGKSDEETYRRIKEIWDKRSK